MNRRTLSCIVAACAVVASLIPPAQGAGPASSWQKEFDLSKCNMVTTGRNDYFILEPGFQLVLEGGGTRVQITVLNETRTVDGVLTRVVEEREWKKGKLYEVARNYFAICEQTKDVYYFGEDVDFYKNDKVVKHDGSWLAGRNGAKAGLIMPGSPKLNMKYYQEIAPGIAMDRAEIVSLTDSCKTPAGTFSKCMKVKEGSELEPNVFEYKYHAPGIGLVRDEDLRLVKYGSTSGK
jgi:hypothetical protein